MSDHHHYEYAEARHDHRGRYADERHEHYREYAEYNHGHHDLDSLIVGLREDLRHAEARIGELEDNQAEMLAQLRVLDRLRPSCVHCHDAAADRQTAGGPACSDCAGDPPDNGPDPDFPESWAFGEANEDQPGPEHGPAAMRRFMREHPLGTPREVHRLCWPDAVCEFAGEDMCGAPAVARVTSRAEPSEHLWCCGSHRDHMLRADPDDAYVSWAKPDDSASATLTCPEEEPPVEGYDPGPEVDDEGGMSEYRYPWPADYQRGM